MKKRNLYMRHLSTIVACICCAFLLASTLLALPSASSSLAASTQRQPPKGARQPLRLSLLRPRGDVPNVPRGFSSGLAAVTWGQNRLDVFYVGKDRAIYHKWWDGAWKPGEDGEKIEGSYALSKVSVVTLGPGRLDVFYVGKDRALYHVAWNGGTWGNNERLGGYIISNVTALSWGGGRIDLFMVGRNHTVLYKWWSGTIWKPGPEGYDSLGGYATSDVSAVSWGVGRLDIFMVGSDRSVYHKAFDGENWQNGYDNLGGKVISNVAAAAWGPGRIDIFVVKQDQAQYHKWFDGSRWLPGPGQTGYEYQGGNLVSDIAVVSRRALYLDTFDIQLNNALYLKWWDGHLGIWGPRSITDFDFQGGSPISDIVATSWGAGRIDTFFVGIDHKLHHKWRDNSMWKPTPTTDEVIGGLVL